MDESTALILIAFNIIFTLIGIRVTGYFFSTLAGLITFYGVAQLVSDGKIVLQTGFNSASNTFYSNPGSSSDYQVFVILLVIFTVTAFYVTLAIKLRQKEQASPY